MGSTPMKLVPPHCPNEECPNWGAPTARFYAKKGYYRLRNNSQLVPRYRCTACGRYFSANAFKGTAGQHRPDLNRALYHLLVSGVSQRRAAKILGCSKRTVDRKLRELGERAKSMHAEALLSESMKTTCVQLDQLESFEHARAKPVTIAVAVRKKTGEILGLRVGRVPTSGKLAELGRERYGWVADDVAATVKGLLLDIQPSVAPDATFITDKARSYPTWIREVFPKANLERHKSMAGEWKRGAPRDFDPMFRVNNTFAKLRNDLGRLARKTWVTTKSRFSLERHLWLYVAWTNKYPIA